MSNYEWGGTKYYYKADMLKAQSRARQLEKWREKNPEPRRTPFQEWLCTFIDEKGIDLSEVVTAGDGSTLQVGDVIQAMHDTAPSEQVGIKRTLVMIDFRNGDVYHFIRHMAQALTAKDKVTL